MTGKWYVDYFDLSTCAIGVQNRDATWGLAARRGENAAVPGRDGTVFIPNKPYDEQSFTLQMFAAGADENGLVPEDSTRALMVRRNLDRLARLFGTGRLLQLAYVDGGLLGDDIPYGLANLVPNPSFEASDGVVTLRENLIPNPSGVTSTGNVIIRRNHIPNPGMEKASSDAPYRTNTVVNPRMVTEGDDTVYRVNLAPNPSFEHSLNNWKVQDEGMYFERSPKSIAGSWPPGAGKWSARCGSSAAIGTQAIVSGPINVDAAETYTLSAYVLNGSGGSRNFRVRIQWLNKSGDSISIVSGSDVALATNGIGRPFCTAVAPAGATQANIRLQCTATNAADVWWWDRVLFEDKNIVDDYFDGNTDEKDGYRHRWTGDVGSSRSQEYGVQPRGWSSDKRLLITTNNPMIGQVSARIDCPGAAPDGTVLIRQTVKAGCAISGGESASGRIYIMTRPGTTRSVSVRMACYDSGGAYLGLVRTGGVDVPDVTVALEGGAWTGVEHPGGVARPKTAAVCLEVRTAGGSWNNDFAYAGAAIVEPLIGVSSYFDGFSKDTTDFNYKWADEPNWSESEMVAVATDYWMIDGGKGSRVGPGFIGDRCLRVEASGSKQVDISTLALGVDGDKPHTWSVYVRVNRAQTVTPYITVGKATTTGPPLALVANTWTRVTQTMSVVDDKNVTVGVRGSAAPLATDTVDIDCGMLEASDGAQEYFDGDSGKLYEWEGGPSASTSVQKKNRADGWSPWGTSLSVYQTSDRFSVGAESVVAIANSAGDFGLTSGSDTIEDDSLDYSFGADVSASRVGTVRVGLRWADGAGNVISDSYSDVAVDGGTSFVRGAITADPPDGSAVVRPYVALLAGFAGDAVYVDAAAFGFGSATSYADGDTVGWEWTGDAHNSESRLTGPAIDSWSTSPSLVVSQSDDWASNRTNSGLVEVIDSDGPHLLITRPAGKSSEAYFPADPDKPVTFAVDVHAREPGMVRAEIVPFAWDGHRMSPSTDPIISGSRMSVSAGDTIRPKITGQFTSATTHYYAQVEFFDGNGGDANVDAGYYVDSAVVALASYSGTYFDGDDEGAGWEDEVDASVSRFYGDARVIDVEVRDAVDIAARGYGSSASFAVHLKAPDVYFKDQADRTTTLSLGRSSMVYSLYALSGGTAPITDSVIQIFGPIENPVLTDVGSGAKLKIKRTIGAKESIIVNNSDWTVTRGKSGASVISDIVREGSHHLLPISPLGTELTPKLKVGGVIGEGAKIQVVARRRFHLA